MHNQVRLFKRIAVATSGNNAFVAAVALKKIRVLQFWIMGAGTVNVKFQSDGAGSPVDLTGLAYLVANTGLSVPYSPEGWFESAAGKTLDINLSASIAVGGALSYVLI